MIPFACASAIASHAWSTKSTASMGPSGPPVSIIAPRSLPARYSITMYGAPFASVPTSSTRATCSLRSFTAARASRAKRSIASASPTACGSTNFDRDALLELKMLGRDDDAHPPEPEYLLNEILAVADVALLHRREGVQRRLVHGVQLIGRGTRQDDVPDRITRGLPHAPRRKAVTQMGA